MDELHARRVRPLEAGHVGVDDEGEDADRGGDDRVGNPLAPVLVRVEVRVGVRG